MPTTSPASHRLLSSTLTALFLLSLMAKGAVTIHFDATIESTRVEEIEIGDSFRYTVIVDETVEDSDSSISPRGSHRALFENALLDQRLTKTGGTGTWISTGTVLNLHVLDPDGTPVPTDKTNLGDSLSFFSLVEANEIPTATHLLGSDTAFIEIISVISYFDVVNDTGIGQTLFEQVDFDPAAWERMEFFHAQGGITDITIVIPEPSVSVLVMTALTGFGFRRGRTGFKEGGTA